MADTLTPLTPAEVAAPDRRATAPVGRHGTGSFRSRVLTPYAMLAPGIILFVLFMAAPIVYTLFLSFQKKQVVGLGLGSGGESQVFAGFENYVGSLTDPEFASSVGRVLLYGVVLIPCMLGLALLFALLLDSPLLRGKRFFRLAFFAPYAVPGVIAAIMWGYLYSPSLSPFSAVTSNVGLLDGGTVLWAIANVVTWVFVGYNMLIIIAQLKSIPVELYEAAKADGGQHHCVSK